MSESITIDIHLGLILSVYEVATWIYFVSSLIALTPRVWTKCKPKVSNLIGIGAVIAGVGAGLALVCGILSPDLTGVELVDTYGLVDFDVYQLYELGSRCKSYEVGLLLDIIMTLLTIMMLGMGAKIHNEIPNNNIAEVKEKENG